MSRFLQLHLLTFYPPANLNRDDTGRPKTAVIGGTTRLRLSSQSLKRAWRTSPEFSEMLDGHLGSRTQRIGRDFAHLALSEFGFSDVESNAFGLLVAATFGKLDDKPKAGQELFTKQLAFVSPTEKSKLRAFLERASGDADLRSKLQAAAGDLRLADADSADGDDQTDDVPNKRTKKRSKATTALLNEVKTEILTLKDTAADIAMFGRMLADNLDYNREAAVQVAHAFTTHKVAVEDDYYVAVDDLKTSTEDAGAGFLGEAGFAAGLFYLYICVDVALLKRNLSDEGLVGTSLAALARAAATVAPTGKQASFASRARAHFIMAESGAQTPRTLGAAFLKPVAGHDPMADSVAALCGLRDAMDSAYGACADHRAIMLVGGAGSLEDILAFCRAV